MSNRADRVFCQVCGGHRDDVGIISHTGKCIECGQAILIDNIYGLHFHSGPAFDRWRRGMAASVGAMLPEPATEAA